MSAAPLTTLASVRPQAKLSFPCVTQPDGSTYCGPPPGICVVERCTSAPFDPVRDCAIVNGAQVCLAPPIACVQLAEPCPTVPTLPIAGVALLIAAVIVVAWRRV